MWIFWVLVIIAILILYFIKTPKGKGIIGEYRINKILKKVSLIYGGLEIGDLMFEDDISSSQIDHILLTQKALYVVETKNYKGHIYGDESAQNWTMTIKHINQKKTKSGKKYSQTHISKHQFYNPLRQNQTHIRKIEKVTKIKGQLPIINIVVFGKRATLKDVTHSDQVFVLHQSQLARTIHKIESQIENELSIEQQIDILDELYLHNIKDRRLKKQHVKRLKAKYNK